MIHDCLIFILVNGVPPAGYVAVVERGEESPHNENDRWGNV